MPYDPRLFMILNALESQQRYGTGGKVVDLLKDVVVGPTTKTSSKSRRKAIGLADEPAATAAAPVPMPDVPMSRRDVLRAGAGQLARGLAPRGALGSMMELAEGSGPSVSNALGEAIDQITKSSQGFKPNPRTLQGQLASLVYGQVPRGKGGKPDFSSKSSIWSYSPEVDGMVYELDVEPDYQTLMNLLSNPRATIQEIAEWGDDFTSQADILRAALTEFDASSMLGFKDLLRQMRQNDPKAYETLKSEIRKVDLPGGDYE